MLTQLALRLLAKSHLAQRSEATVDLSKESSMVIVVQDDGSLCKLCSFGPEQTQTSFHISFLQSPHAAMRGQR
jgi:hypothetical protein